MLTRHSLLLFFLLSFPFNVFADFECRDAFVRSKLYYALKAVKKHENDISVHSQFTSVAAERKLVPLWNKPVPNVPTRIEFVLPKDVQLINHQLPRAANATTVKLGEPGSAGLMARASYAYADHSFSTNVTFSTRALTSNLLNMKIPGKKNWLVGEDATAAVLYLHGGGTRSTGSHTAEGLISHYKPFGVDVVALDLPWHAEGHREILSDFESEIKSLSAFAQKYIPPNVPLFVWGHSWGAVWAEMLMQMSAKPHSEFSFHRNLKGVMIMAPAMDAAPGQDVGNKIAEYQRRLEDAKKNKSHLYAPNEAFIYTQMVEQGKSNPMSSIFSMSTILYLNQIVPEHRGVNFVKALVVVGKRDPLVYIGFEDLFDFYPKLENVEFHVVKGAGHLLRDYHYPGTTEAVDVKLASDFIAKRIGEDTLIRRKNPPNFSYISIVQEYANKFDFREYVNEHSYFTERRTKVYRDVQKIGEQLRESVQLAFENYHSPVVRVKHALEQLMSVKNLHEYQEAMIEMKVILHPEFLRKLGHKGLIERLKNINDFLMLQEPFGEAHDTSWSNRHIDALVDRVKEIFDDERFVNFFQKNSSSKKGPALVRKIVESPNLETAMSRVKEEQLPAAVEIVILSKLVEMFKIKAILEGTYTPTLEGIRERSVFDQEDIDKIRLRIEGIKANVEQIKILKTEIINNTHQFKALVKNNFHFLEDVAHYIRIIKVAFAKSAQEIPEALKEELSRSREELNALEEALDALNTAMEKVSVNEMSKNNKLMTLNLFSELINKYEHEMNRFMEQYENYATDKRHLRRDLIVVIERGEMGEEFKEAVLAIYGRGSDGHRPLVGANTLYLQLEKNIENMADLESKLYFKKAKMIELGENYQELFTSLLQMIQLRDDKDVLAIVPDVYVYRGEMVKRILEENGVIHSELSEQERRLEFFNYIQNNESHFQSIDKDWNYNLQSDLPPLLPTHRSVEF